jgi:hypothetical protein
VVEFNYQSECLPPVWTQYEEPVKGEEAANDELSMQQISLIVVCSILVVTLCGCICLLGVYFRDMYVRKYKAPKFPARNESDLEEKRFDNSFKSRSTLKQVGFAPDQHSKRTDLFTPDNFSSSSTGEHPIHRTVLYKRRTQIQTQFVIDDISSNKNY